MTQRAACCLCSSDFSLGFAQRQHIHTYKLGFWEETEIIPRVPKAFFSYQADILYKALYNTSLFWFKSLSHYRHLVASSPSSGISIVWRADSWGAACCRRQLPALQTMEMPLDGNKYDWLLNLQTLYNTRLLNSYVWEESAFKTKQLLRFIQIRFNWV